MLQLYKKNNKKHLLQAHTLYLLFRAQQKALNLLFRANTSISYLLFRARIV